jgi:V8-like Glu-specific endopeptidase
MITLENQDLQELVKLLQSREQFRTEEARRSLMILAGLAELLPLIDLSGPSGVVAVNVVAFLADFGHVTYDNEALGQFLNTLKSAVGMENQRFLDALLVKYAMMEPVAPQEGVDDWKSAATQDEVLEKVFGENTLRPIAFLMRGVEVSGAVAQIAVSEGAKSWTGTGFLVAPELAMTNHHVISSAGQLGGVSIRFNYQLDFNNREMPITEYRAVADGPFHANQALDYAVFQVEKQPGLEWGYLRLQPRSVEKNERINIIQHPNGLPKQISMQNNLVEYVGGHVLQYVTSTNPGSSGSPVFNDRWEVVGLHHAGGELVEPTSGQYFNRNEGILISSIWDDLPDAIRKQIEQAASI